MSVRNATRALAVAMAFALAAGCGGGDGPTPPGGPASLSITPSSDVRLGVGQTAQLTATPKDAAGNNVSANVEWKSDNTAIATVSSTGLVTGVAIGTTKVRATAGSVSQEVTVTVQAAQFNVNPKSACSSPDLRSYRVMAQSAHLIIVEGLDTPAGGFTTQDYQDIANTFESLVWPVVTANFGMPADIDGNGKVIAYYTRAVNELTEANSQSVVGGFFFGRDLFPKVASGRFPACAGSNEAEMFYMLVPDPTGVVNGNVRTVDLVRRLTVGVLGHEFQHLINASRRLYVNQTAIYPEVSYMEEGLSHIAEELIFYEASGRAPRTNLDSIAIRSSDQVRNAFNSYMISNASRFSSYLKDPAGNSPYQSDADLATRGAIWSFLRYLADRGVPGSVVNEPACTGAALSIGQQCAAEGSAAASFAVSGGATGGEFAVVAFAAGSSLTTTASATNTITAVGPPNPWVGSGSSAQLSQFGVEGVGGATSLAFADAFHARLRRMERSELPQRVAGARAAYLLKDRASARMYAAPPTGPSMAHIPVEPVWGQLVNSPDTGMVNLRGRFGPDIPGAAQDWAVANYVDDTGLPGIPAQHTHPSWNYRSLLSVLNNGVYPLQTSSLTTPTQQTTVDGGAAYYRFGLIPGATSTVSFTVNGGAPPGNLKVVVIRTK